MEDEQIEAIKQYFEPLSIYVKSRSLVSDLIMCYSKNAQRKWMKFRRSCEQKCGILKRCANNFSQRKKIQVTWNIGIG